MDALIAECLSKKLKEGLLESTRYKLLNYDDGKNDDRGCFGKFDIENNRGIVYEILVVAQRYHDGKKDRYYVTIWDKEHEQAAIAELWEISLKGEDQNLVLLWTYKPTKQDGLNQERRNIFIENVGSLDVEVALPNAQVTVDSFLDRLFDLAKNRLMADERPLA